MILIFCFPLLFCSKSSRAQEQEIQQLLLDLEKLSQLKNILSDLKKGYEIHSGGYQAIKNISEGNFNLHQAFLDHLLEVNPMVRNYKRVADIVSLQIRIVATYKQTFKQFKASGKFRPEEIQYMSQVYVNLFSQSFKNLEDLTMVLTTGKLRMSDDERIGAIDTIWKEIEEEWTFLRHFNGQAKVLAIQRVKEAGDINSLKGIYGIQ